MPGAVLVTSEWLGLHASGSFPPIADVSSLRASALGPIRPIETLIRLLDDRGTHPPAVG